MGGAGGGGDGGVIAWTVLEVWLHEQCWRCDCVPGSVQHWGREVGVVVGGECSPCSLAGLSSQ